MNRPAETSPERGRSLFLEDSLVACIFGAILLGLPVEWAALAGLAVVAVVRRPQPVVLAGLVILPLVGSFTTVALLLFVVIVAAVIGWSRGLANQPSRAVLPILALGIWTIVTYLLRQDVPFGGPTMQDLAQPIAGMLIALVTAVFPPQFRDLQRVCLLTLGVVGLNVIGVALEAGARVYALGLNPNYIAALITALMCVCLVKTGRWERFVSLGILPIGLLALIRTQSRGGLIALAIGVVVWLVLSQRSRIVEPRRVVAILTVIGAVAVISPQAYSFIEGSLLGGRNVAASAISDQGRSVVLGKSIELALANPVFGVGYGNFAAVAAGLPGLHTYINTHDEFTQLAAEMGILGLILFLLPVSAAILRVSGTRRATLLPGLLCFIASLAFGNELNDLATACVFWIMLGMALAGSGISPTQQRRLPSR